MQLREQDSGKKARLLKRSRKLEEESKLMLLSKRQKNRKIHRSPQETKQSWGNMNCLQTANTESVLDLKS